METGLSDDAHDQLQEVEELLSARIDRAQPEADHQRPALVWVLPHDRAGDLRCVQLADGLAFRTGASEEGAWVEVREGQQIVRFVVVV